ncbi:MAG TPA: hypothetical protein VG146_01800 [Verrucomicrobiae bacterium]|nr:hypothetical protein [Verrucomicrobiae bacterium]
MKIKMHATKTGRRLPMVLLAICLTAGLTGCLHPQVKVIDPTTTVQRLPRGTNVTACVDGYFVPDATMLRILDHLGELDVFGTNQTK